MASRKNPPPPSPLADLQGTILTAGPVLTSPPAAPLEASNELFLNRDLSWLRFNERVLQEALDPRTPLLERVKFFQIFTTNLDEFFMKRVGGLKRQLALGIKEGVDPGFSSEGLLHDIRRQVQPILQARNAAWVQDISPALEREGILLLKWNDLSANEKSSIGGYFEKNLFPILTPLAVDPGHPFPFISNLSTSLGVLLRNPRTEHSDEFAYATESLFARVKIPSSFASWLKLPSSSGSEDRLISMREVIAHHADRLFPGMEILGSLIFRITRNADVERDEEDAEDLLEMVTEELRERRFAKVVRLEHSASPNLALRDFLRTEMELSETDTYEQEFTDVDFSQLEPIWSLNRRKHRYRPWNPITPEPLLDEDTSIFGLIRDQDLLVHHPYESFHQTVERFVRTAVNDPKVQAIKMVLYRTGSDSPFIPLLIRAAENGKQVVCLVELKARFDEARNIQVARMLEKAGVHVVYGIVGLKTHCKTTLVVRQEGDEVRSYAHIGTGNYHAGTSRLYTDLGLFTSKPEFTQDVVQLFHYLTGRSLNRSYNKLIVAPLLMKQRFLELIRFEADQARAGKPARIIGKMNQLEDPEIIRELYAASQAGVRIDLIVRGFCCLRPQIPGLSENIWVSCVIGRFLEHSRIFLFQHGTSSPDQGQMYIGSADWMSRNLNWRVEAVCPIEDKAHKQRLWDLLQMLLADRRQAWDLRGDGTYVQRQPQNEAEQEGTHDRLMRLYESSHQLGHA
jgi:polyphosphate kinase